MWRCIRCVVRVSVGAGCGGSRARSTAAADTHQVQAMDKLQNNPYYDKYAARIAELQRTQPQEFERRAQVVAPKTKPPLPAAEPELGQYAAMLKPKPAAVSAAPLKPRRLDDIMRMELLDDKSALEVGELWRQYHSSKPALLCAVVPAEAHSRASQHAHDYPTFVVPLPRQHGYEFFLLQTVADTVHYTPLLAYQVHGENAPECLTLTYYTELAHKGVVLMRGEYDKSVLSAAEARCLANQYALYYGGCDPQRLDLLRQFTENPDSFQHMTLVQQLENITLEADPGVDNAK